MSRKQQHTVRKCRKPERRETSLKAVLMQIEQKKREEKGQLCVLLHHVPGNLPQVYVLENWKHGHKCSYYLIHHSTNLETAQMSDSWWKITKMCQVHTPECHSLERRRAVVICEHHRETCRASCQGKEASSHYAHRMDWITETAVKIENTWARCPGVRRQWRTTVNGYWRLLSGLMKML